MATVNYISYAKQSAATLRGVIGYVCQKRKSGIEREFANRRHWEYGLLPQRNDTIKLLSGLNCTPECAYSEFISTKASYNKPGGVQFYHYTQSFKDGENISPMIAHEIAMKFANEHYSDYEVLIATHVDNEHLHSHFIINSVSFETGKKLHETPDTLRQLRHTSDIICKDYGLPVLEPYTYGRSNTMGRAEMRATEKGHSWKYKLCLSIELCMKKSNTKKEFVEKMEELGYKVKWSDTRKNITYSCPNGRDVRDVWLYGDKFLKANMENEFTIRWGVYNEQGIDTGWEYERNELYSGQSLLPSYSVTSSLAGEVIRSLRNIESAANHDDELEEIANLAALTALSFVGVYLLIDRLYKMSQEHLNDEILEDMIEEIKIDPENTMDYEQEQEFTMSME